MSLHVTLQTCHAHDNDDKVLGSLVIKLPLDDIDSFVDESSQNFFL